MWYVEKDGEVLETFDSEASAERYAMMIGLDAVVLPGFDEENVPDTFGVFFSEGELESEVASDEWLVKMLAAVGESSEDEDEGEEFWYDEDEGV